MKIAVWGMFLAALSLVCSSCGKQEVRPYNYSVIVVNNYFERIDSVKLSCYELNSIEVNNNSNEIILSQEDYPLSFISASGLHYSANLKIQGVKENLQIVVDNNGRVIII